MADQLRVPLDEDEESHLDLRPLLWLGGWGGGAVLALAVAVSVSRTDWGEQRVDAALSAFNGSQQEHSLRATGVEMLARADAEREIRRTADAIRVLASDRDRLAQRLTALERNLEGLTGTIKRQTEHAPADSATSSPSPPAPTSVAPSASATPPASTPSTLTPSAPMTLPSAPTVQIPSAATTTSAAVPAPPAALAAAAPPPATPPHAPTTGREDISARVVPQPTTTATTPTTAESAPPKEPASPAASPATKPPARSATMALIQSYATATAIPEPELTAPPSTQPALPPPATAPKPEFAIELGAAPTVSGLRTLWERTRARQPAHLGNLHPLISVRDGAKPGTAELRLVAGPIANAATAARLCAALVTAGVPCQPAMFDGQRLALR